MKPVILLDLNYTLVANSHMKRAPFLEQIKQERYRSDLIDLVRPFEVILITARPVKYKAVTLANIEGQTNWQPAAAYFNDTFLPPHLFKRLTFVEKIEWKYSPEKFVAIESNPKTIKEYHLLGITCLSIIPEIPYKNKKEPEKDK
ncbi:MAG: hypothetical protein ACYC09_14815 [Bacteroidota bacterium]